MTTHYLNYKWENGIPYGLKKTEPEGITYKIPADPYNKQISVEEYENGAFKKVIYDSRLLDFRHLKPENQLAWEKTELNGTCFIRNQDDRLIVIEEYSFEKGLCRQCQIFSPQKVLLCLHKMYYKKLSDSFNGVILYDINEKPIIKKEYEIDDETGLFTTLLKEEQNICTY